jgi:hypothetical protein
MDQGTTAPIFADKTKHFMFDLIPFAGTRREMRYMNFFADLIGQFLQFDLPKSHSRTITSTPIRINVDGVGTRITLFTHLLQLLMLLTAKAAVSLLIHPLPLVIS